MNSYDHVVLQKHFFSSVLPRLFFQQHPSQSHRYDECLIPSGEITHSKVSLGQKCINMDCSIFIVLYPYWYKTTNINDFTIIMCRNYASSFLTYSLLFIANDCHAILFLSLYVRNSTSGVDFQMSSGSWEVLNLSKGRMLIFYSLMARWNLCFRLLYFFSFLFSLE